MIHKTEGIVLNNTKYSENSVICNIFTREYGKVGFIINGVRNNKGAIKNSHIQPLNLVELDMYYNTSKSLQRIKDLKVTPHLHDLHSNPIKISISFLMTELLSKSIREEEKNEELFEFIRTNVLMTNNSSKNELSNYPSYFILNLASILGHNIANDVLHNSSELHNSNNQGIYSSRSLSTITFNSEEKDRILSLLTDAYQNIIGENWSKIERTLILNKSLDYFQSVVLENSKVKSLSIIRDVMS